MKHPLACSFAIVGIACFALSLRRKQPWQAMGIVFSLFCALAYIIE